MGIEPKPPIPSKPTINVGKRRPLSRTSEIRNSFLTGGSANNNNNNNSYNYRIQQWKTPASSTSHRTDRQKSLDSVESALNSSGASSSIGSECRCNREIYSKHLNQDILTIKTYLLRLKRTLAENSSLHRSESIESLSGESTTSSQQQEINNDGGDQIQDLKRQIVYLKQQNDDKDRTIKLLKRQLEAANKKNGKSNVSSTTSTYSNHNRSASTTLINTATQTDKHSEECGIDEINEHENESINIESRHESTSTSHT